MESKVKMAKLIIDVFHSADKLSGTHVKLEAHGSNLAHHVLCGPLDSRLNTKCA